MLDSEMKMLDQVHNVCRSCYASLNSLGRIRKYLCDSSMEILVHASITCKVDSLNSLLSGIPDYALHRVQMVLNNSARLLTRTNSKDQITPVLKELHRLPVEALIDYKILLLTYKALNGFGPVYMRELLHLKQHKRETRSSRDFLMLEVPRTRLKTLGDRTFSCTAATHWNALPLELPSVPSLSVFKQQLKTFLFK